MAPYLKFRPIETFLTFVLLHSLLTSDCCSYFGKKNIQVRQAAEGSFWIVYFMVLLIQCDTGIALLAYMDGITGSPTLGGVVLATISGAAYAVFKVSVTLMKLTH